MYYVYVALFIYCLIKFDKWYMKKKESYLAKKYKEENKKSLVIGMMKL